MNLDEQLERSVERLERRELAANKVTFVALLARCIDEDALRIGRRIHAQIARLGRECEAFLGNHLVEMYGKCRSLGNARATFEVISEQNRNLFSWNIMLAAYTQNGHINKARALFDEMTERNVVSWNVLLAGYARIGNVDRAKSLFDAMPDRDPVSWNTLITAYAQEGDLLAARSLLEHMPARSVASWNAMITAYARSGDARSAIELLARMDLSGERANLVTLVGAIGACPDLRSTTFLHSSLAAAALDSHPIAASALVSAYARSGAVELASRTFAAIARKDAVAYTAMLAALAHNSLARDAIDLFRAMSLEGLRAGAIALLTIFDACAIDPSTLAAGRAIHASLAGSGLDLDAAVGTAIVTMYGNAGSLAEAAAAFEALPCKTVAAWSSMIAASARSGHSRTALELFRIMLLDGVDANEITLVSALNACSSAGMIAEGWRLLAGARSDFALPQTLKHFQCAIDLLGRAGQLELAEELAASMPFEAGWVARATLASACRTHGDVEHGLRAMGSGSRSRSRSGSESSSSSSASSSASTSTSTSSPPSFSSSAAAAAVLIANIYSSSSTL